MFGKLNLPVPRLMPDRLADVLRQAIVGGKLRPGDRINESEIADAYHISRTPIREALRMLGQEGLVVVRPGRGAFVRVLTAEDVLEAYAVKSMTEGYAARLATQRMTDAELDTLGRYFQRMEAEAGHPSGARYLEASRRFHNAIISASGNAALVEIHRGIDQKIHWLRALSLSRPGRIPVSLADHRAILDAMRRRDADEAERLTREHVERAGRELAPALAEVVAERGGLAVLRPRRRPARAGAAAGSRSER
ncbi:MAG TPA: GntR family transcriptional regulator [Thermodesulfobacteriota bacterium]